MLLDNPDYLVKISFKLDLIPDTEALHQVVDVVLPIPVLVQINRVDKNLIPGEGFDVSFYSQAELYEITDNPVGKVRKMEQKPAFNLLDGIRAKGAFSFFGKELLKVFLCLTTGKLLCIKCYPACGDPVFCKFVMKPGPSLKGEDYLANRMLLDEVDILLIISEEKGCIRDIVLN
ncbi:hypothetical protein ES705_43501 [subsurface metagenome]